MGTATETLNQLAFLQWQTRLHYIHVQCSLYITCVEKCLNKGHVTAKWNNFSVIFVNNLYLCWNTHENISYIPYILITELRGTGTCSVLWIIPAVESKVFQKKTIHISLLTLLTYIRLTYSTALFNTVY